MKKKYIFQIIILSIIIAISAFTYLKFFKVENFKKNIVIIEDKDQNKTLAEVDAISKERNILMILNILMKI